MVNVLLHHGRVLNFVHSVYEGGNVSFMGDMDPNYFFVMHMMKTFTNELKHNDILELWCTIREEGIETRLSCLHSNEDMLQIIERLERTTSDDLHVYTVHSKDGSNYFNTVEGYCKGSGEGYSNGATVEAIELDDEAVEDLGIDEVGLGEGGLDEIGIDKVNEQQAGTSTVGSTQTQTRNNTDVNARVQAGISTAEEATTSKHT
ncbi:hypothetical protein CJ030_MR4G013693 [Morella rubra]|uniref:PB1-like domain-containing protein n=1 Tax=Morella rubra TaxID=262757 RepID=A0A6A1WT07_9ROSI|nr:hypothetical protein CJ030_MR4G013693 [Morella rubra]